MTNQDFYPLCLEPIAKEVVWGGRNLETLLGKSLPADQKIGETWEAWDGCPIANGKFRGMTLGDLLKTNATAILGTAATDGSRFPLLFKFIDAQDDLSVQVHPDDNAAQLIERQPFGKTEAWYVLHAKPGANLIHGFTHDVRPAQVTEYLNQNKLHELLAYVPVQSGDVVFVPAGTVHAITKGIVLAEIQENSDITYRLYDWGRQGRQLHVEQSLRVLEFKGLSNHKIPAIVIHHAEFDHHYLVACRYFSLERYDVRKPIVDLQLNNKFSILSVIEGEAAITFGKNFMQSEMAKQGQTLVLPASLKAFGISPRATACQVLRMYVPDLRADVIEPLERQGISSDQITRLCGAQPEHNDIAQLLR